MLIGLTGGIGSGKSTIAAELQRLGYPVFDTDSEAKRIIVHNPAVRSQIELLFGSEVFDGDTYLTKKVAAQVFQDPTLLHRLNHIVHPAVRFELEHWYKHTPPSMGAGAEGGSFSPPSTGGAGGGLAFVESAILYESGLYELCDRVVEVTAPEEVRIQRVLARDHTTIDNVRARLRAQESSATCNSPQGVQPASCFLSNDGNIPVPELVQQLLQQL